MSFVSAAYLVFLSIVFILYHATSSIRIQNAVILVASYVFYGWFDWRFLPLLVAVSLANYFAALVIAGLENDRARKAVLVGALAVSLVALAVFKYFNFFIDSAATLAGVAGLQFTAPTLKLILPLGISFMTFQGMAYVIDVYRREHAAEPDLIRFLAFKAFFPQLVAGPIERASHLLDQFSKPRTIDEIKIGRALWLLAYGYALKIVIADSMAPIVDSLFIVNQPFGWSVILGTIAFGIQIYADFCGYSLIAKGSALLFGFDLIWNFRFPYWSVSISDFWRRWHISLSRWLRDYLYIPLGGNRHGDLATARNLMITMGLGGLWHGASWNFVFWGLLHGAALVAWRFLPIATDPSTRAGKVLGWAATMVVAFVGWFFFRATSWDVLTVMVAALPNLEWLPIHDALLSAIVFCVVVIAILEYVLQTWGDYVVVEAPSWVAYSACSVLAVMAVALVGRHQVSFIYFQF